MKKSTLIFLFLLLMVKCWAQRTDSLSTAPLLPDSVIILDSTEVKKGIFTFFSKDYPNPRKAALLSLVIPGAGQVYNKRWWKVPLVYGAMGGMVVAIDFNQDLYRRLKTAYLQKINNQEVEPELARLDARTLRILRDRYDKNTQLSYVGLVVVYALQSVEAFVDSHLKTFTVNDDLSLQVKPSFHTDLLAGQPTVGIGVALKFE